MPCAAAVGTFERGTFSSERIQAAYPCVAWVRPRTRFRSRTWLCLHLASPATIKRVTWLYTIKPPTGTLHGPFKSQTNQIIFILVLVDNDISLKS